MRVYDIDRKEKNIIQSVAFLKEGDQVQVILLTF